MKLAILQNSDVMEKKTDSGLGLSDPKLYRNKWFCFRTKIKVNFVDLCYDSNEIGPDQVMIRLYGLIWGLTWNYNTFIRYVCWYEPMCFEANKICIRLNLDSFKTCLNFISAYFHFFSKHWLFHRCSFTFERWMFWKSGIQL